MSLDHPLSTASASKLLALAICQILCSYLLSVMGNAIAVHADASGLKSYPSNRVLRLARRVRPFPPSIDD